jgi:hypothetical protein
MSYAVEEYAYAQPVDQQDFAHADSSLQRSLAGQLLFVLPVILSGLSYVAGGVAPLTDMSFLLLTGLCLVFFFAELAHFRKRQGIGGLLVFGGVLTWFCHDYLYTWLGHNFSDGTSAFTAELIAKAAFFHCLFVAIMVFVLNIDLPMLRWVDRLVVIVPEPAQQGSYVVLLVISMLIAMSPMVLLVSEPFYVSLWKNISLQSGDIHWTVGRTVLGFAQNLNYDWGGYVAFILQFGQVVGILGAAYAILVAPTWAGRIFGMACWYFWVAYTFPSFRRGELVGMMLPLVALLYYRFCIFGQFKFQLPQYGWRAYIIAGGVFLVMFVLVQYQSAVRSLDAVQLFAARGNTMFSEGLKAWQFFPDGNGDKYYYEAFPGSNLVRPLPETLYWFLVDPIPRALWTTKPIDGFNTWYNTFMTGERNGNTGTTISDGAVGAWYFRYGPWGVIQGALLYGWLMGVSERALRRCHDRPISLLFAFAFATFMFRSYRDLWFQSLYPIMISAVILYLVIRFIGAAPRQVEMVGAELVETAA